MTTFRRCSFRRAGASSRSLLNDRVPICLIVLALAVRIGLLFIPAFSTDTQRFLSDGINLLEGRNPYTAAPALPIAYPHLRSFYTPLMELFFAFAAWLMRDPMIFRLLGGAAELCFLIWYYWQKRKRPLPCGLALFLLFNPLSLHEIWREGHLDHVAVFFLYLAIINLRAAFAFGRNRGRAVLFTLCSIAWKFVGVFAVLFLLRQSESSPLKRAFARVANLFIFFAVAFFALQLLPAYVFTDYAERGLTVYTTYWHHGNGIVHLLMRQGFVDAHAVYLVQRLIVLLLLVLAGFYLAGRLSYTSALCIGAGTLLVLFPVQHPWYYFLLFPFILLYRRWRWPLVMLCLLAPLSYWGYKPEFAWVGYPIVLGAWLSAAFYMLRRSAVERV